MREQRRGCEGRRRNAFVSQLIWRGQKKPCNSGATCSLARRDVCGGEGQREEASHGEECNARQGVKEEGGDALHALVEIEAGLGVIMSQKRERWKRL
jgi:hypothetical protein